MNTSLLRINIENAVKLLIVVGIIIFIYPDLNNSLTIMFKNYPDKAGDLLLAVSTLVVGAMFAYFSFSYTIVQRNSFIARLLVYLKTFLLLLVILLTLVMSEILFPIFLGGLSWLFTLITGCLMTACVLYDITNIQAIGKDW